MSNNYFQFKQFKINHEKSAMKVGTDGVLLGAWAEIANYKTVLDVGTGTGLIAIMIAQRCESKIDGVENDQKSFDEALINVANCPWKNRINLFFSSFQNFYKNQSNKYDTIVSNPPFFINSYKPDSSKKLKAKHTDSLAYKELIEGCKLLLPQNGRFSCILSLSEGQLFIDMAKNKDFFCSRLTHVKPKPSKPANRLLLEFQFKKCNPISNTLVIRNEDNSFTEEYKNLTKDFYLDF